MYKSIYDFVLSRGIATTPYRELRDVAAHIILGNPGDYPEIESYSKEERKKQKRLCPAVPKGNTPSPICAKVGFIFPEPDENGEIDKTSKQRHDVWMKSMADGAEHSATINAILNFVIRVETDDSYRKSFLGLLHEKKLKPSDYVSFRIAAENAENRKDWTEWFDQYCAEMKSEGVDKGRVISCISGKPVTPIIGAFPKIMTPQTGSGVPVFSNNHKKVTGTRCSFSSFGEDSGFACPMSQSEADAIKAGMEYLLRTPENYDSRLSILFWYDDPQSENLIKEMLHTMTEEEYQAFCDRLSTSETTEDITQKNGIAAEKEVAFKNLHRYLWVGDTQKKMGKRIASYHVMHYAVPAKGRFYISDYCCRSYLDLKKQILQWCQDTKMYGLTLNSDSMERKNTSLINIAIFFKDPDLGHDLTELFLSIIENRPMSICILQKAQEHFLKCVELGQWSDYLWNGTKKVSVAGKMMTYTPLELLQLMKGYLIRQGDEEMVKAEKLYNYHGKYQIAYACGRWLACVDRLQYRTSGKVGGVNLSTSQKYYKMMKTAPAKTFTLVSDKKEHYLGKLHSIELKMQFECTFGEIAGMIAEVGDIPDKFTLEEQAAFDLGFAQQSMEFVVEYKQFVKVKELEKKKENESEEKGHE